MDKKKAINPANQHAFTPLKQMEYEWSKQNNFFRGVSSFFSKSASQRNCHQWGNGNDHYAYHKKDACIFTNDVK